MSFPRNASLTLRTCDILGNEYTPGFTSNDSWTWQNINLRTLLGDLYDKYDLFTLNLEQIASGVSDVNLGSSLNDICVQINMSGLPFVNQTYNPVSGYNGSYNTLTCYEFVRGYSNIVNYQGTYLTFSKNQEQISLNIYYKKVSDGGNCNVVLFPNVVFTFSITGVEK